MNKPLLALAAALAAVPAAADVSCGDPRQAEAYVGAERVAVLAAALPDDSQTRLRSEAGFRDQFLHVQCLVKRGSCLDAANYDGAVCSDDDFLDTTLFNPQYLTRDQRPLYSARLERIMRDTFMAQRPGGRRGG